MNEFISGDEVKLAWAKGEKVQWRQSFDWDDLGATNILGIFDDEDIEFRLKPRTITINGMEVPAPFEPKDGDKYWFMDVNNRRGYEYDVCGIDHFNDEQWSFFGTWRTEEEIKQVVAALRSVFGKK